MSIIYVKTRDGEFVPVNTCINSGSDPGGNYVLTAADKEEIAAIAAEMVEIPGSGVNPDITELVERAETAATTAEAAATAAESAASSADSNRGNASVSAANASRSATQAKGFATAAEEAAINTEAAATRAEEAATRAEEAVANMGSGGNADCTCNIYVGTEQPTDGTEYWLDTSEDENGNTGSGGGDSGSGDDSGNEPIVYTITRTLTGCASSSTANSITAGSFYKETITAESGYTLSGATVNITMGGVDISDSFVDGVLTIDEVNGNIVISVIAKGNAWETVTLTYGPLTGTNLDGSIYSDEGETKLGTPGRGWCWSEVFNKDTVVSVTVTNNGVICYVGYAYNPADNTPIDIYNASTVAAGKTQTIEMIIPSGKQLVVCGNYSQHWTIEAKKQV